MNRLVNEIGTRIIRSDQETGEIPIPVEGSDNLACVFVGQTDEEFHPKFSSTRLAVVDGINDGISELGEDVLSEVVGDARTSGELSNFLGLDPDDDPWSRTRLYRDIADLRSPERQLLEGPAIAVWWNKDGIHYVIVGQSRPPITEAILLRMANSLEFVRTLGPPYYPD